MMTERAEFDAIRPYEAGEMKQAFEELLADRQFNLVMKGFALGCLKWCVMACCAWLLLVSKRHSTSRSDS